MALTVAELNTRLTADIRDLQSGLKKAQSDISGFESKASGGLGKFAGKAKVAAGVAGVAVLAFAKQAVDAASNLSEALNKSNTIFGANANAIDQWARGAAEDFGLSRRAALDAAGSFGNMFTQLGIGSQQAAEMSQSITELAADFASFHNADIESVIQAQSAAFRGEYDALQRFLPLINAATVEQKALEMTGKRTTSALTAQEKALAVNALMMEGAGAAAGDFDRTSGGLANTQRTLAAKIEDTKAIIGEKLQPVMLQVVSWLNSDGIPGFLKFAEVLGEGIADAAAFAIGGLADIASATAQILEVIDSVTPGLEGVPERLQRGVEVMRGYEEQLHGVSFEMEFAAGGATNLSTAQDKVTTATGKTAKELKAEADALVDLKDAKFAATDAARGLADAQDGVVDAQRELNELLATGGVDMEKVKAAQEDLIGVQNDLEDALKDVVKAQEAVRKALEPAAPRSLAKAERGLEDANDDVTKAGISLRDAQADLNELQTAGTATADELTSAQLRVNDAQRAVKDAEDRVIESQADLNELQKQGTTDSDAYKTASENLQTAQEKAGAATAAFHTAQDALNTAQAVAPGYADAVKTANENLNTANWNVEKATWAAEKAQAAYNTALNGQPKEVKTTVTVDRKETTTATTVQQHVASMASGTTWVGPNFVGPLQAGWARLPKMGPYTKEQADAARMLDLPVLHQGGVVPGPRGADVPIMAQAGERVISANQAGGGGNSYTINVYAWDTRDGGEQAVEAIRAYERRNGTGWRN